MTRLIEDGDDRKKKERGSRAVFVGMDSRYSVVKQTERSPHRPHIDDVIASLLECHKEGEKERKGSRN